MTHEDAEWTADQAPRIKDKRPQLARLWVCLPLLAGLYLPFIGGGLLTDDFAHVVHVSNLDSTARLIDRPDAFGFYRPVTQASLAIVPGLDGSLRVQARALNVVLHAVVIALAVWVARLTLQSTFAAGLAALAFAMTPKAPSIAVLWISARGELLMALFSLAAIAAWIVWTRNGRPSWLAATTVAYALALLSKETAMLLPAVLLFTPRAERPWASRLAAAAMLVGLGVAFYAWRIQVGALSPFSGDLHYDLAVPLARVWRSASNYVGRMIVAPLCLIVLLSLTRLINRRRAMPAGPHSYLFRLDVIAFAAAFVIVFLAPVLPIALRSEIYLYLPVFGVCLFAGWLAELLVHRVSPRVLAAAVGLYVIVFAGYQIGRSLAIHRNLVFTAELVAALQRGPNLPGQISRAILIPSNTETERFLQDSVGGYFSAVLQHAFPRARLTGDVQYGSEPPQQAGVRLTCAYRETDGVVISPAP